MNFHNGSFPLKKEGHLSKPFTLTNAPVRVKNCDLLTGRHRALDFNRRHRDAIAILQVSVFRYRLTVDTNQVIFAATVGKFLVKEFVYGDIFFHLHKICEAATVAI